MDYKIEKFATLSFVEKLGKRRFFVKRKWTVCMVPTDRSYTPEEMLDILKNSDHLSVSGYASTEKSAYRQIELAKKQMKITFDWTRSD